LKWLELSVESPPEFVEPLSQIFYRYGHGGVSVEMEGGYSPDEGEEPPVTGMVTLKTYLPLDSTTSLRRSRIDIGVRLVSHVSSISALQERELDEDEWQNSWKEHFYVLHIGERTVIAPTWREYEPGPSDIVVTLDPGMAFGTGHHPTTRMCLESLESLLAPGMDILDVGCGSGILSIAAAKQDARTVMGIEIDSVAVGVAKQNVRDNGMGHSVRIAQGTLPHPDVQPSSYDIVIANISAKVVIELAGELTAALRPTGKLIASGILLKDSDRVNEGLASAGSITEETVVDGDWVTLVASTPGPS